MTFLVRSVDMYGYNGRDLHPRQEHEGQTVTLVSMSSYTPEGDLVYDAQRTPVLKGVADEAVFVCMTADRELVEFMEHELAQREGGFKMTRRIHWLVGAILALSGWLIMPNGPWYQEVAAGMLLILSFDWWSSPEAWGVTK